MTSKTTLLGWFCDNIRELYASTFMRVFFIALLTLLAVGSIVSLIRSWWRIRQGLDQWPNPRGRYYFEWLSLKNEVEDYYPWLAKKMRNREPWKSWVELDKKSNIPEKKDNSSRSRDITAEN